MAHYDLRDYLLQTAWIDRVTWRFGSQYLSPWINRGLSRTLSASCYDLCYVDGGDWVMPSTIILLRQYANKIINYNIDDPLGQRDGARSMAYRRCLPYYDLCVVMRPQNVTEAKSFGARNVMRVYRSADEVTHAPRIISRQDEDRWSTDVLFLGTWFPERGSFLLELIERGVPVTIRGANWHKAPEWSRLQCNWRGGPLYDDDYAKAIQCAKVNLGLVSKGNRDLHTTRSLEIPALGGLLCAERTIEHVSMFDEGREALFWGNPSECADVCQYALKNAEPRESIAAAGQARIAADGHYNEPVLSAILRLVADELPVRRNAHES